MILSSFAMILSLIVVFISELKITNTIISKINHKTIHSDIWNNVIDYKNGTTMSFIYDDAEYIGILDMHEEKGNDSWFILDDYVVKDESGEYASRDMKVKSKLAVNLNGVKRVELYYGDEGANIPSKIDSWFKAKRKR